jgi:ribosomal protein S18 acetylase RimI-like enzyme
MTVLRRFLLFVACLVAGSATGVLGALATGNEWWYVAVPITLALGWLWVGTPEQCARAERESQDATRGPGCARSFNAFRQAPHAMPTIVPAAPNDAAAILDIQRRAFAQEARLCDNWEIPPLTEALDAVAAHIQSQTVLTARDGTDIIGSVRGIVAGTVCTVRGLSIEPAHQGRGIGSSLLRAIEHAHPQATHFELTTNTVIDSNVRFYERHGYRITELTRYSDRITLAQMRKSAVAADDVGR